MIVKEKLELEVTVDKRHIVTIGERLYTESVELLRELVNNAYDADAERVDVEITPEKARAFNEAMRTFVAAEPDRVELLQILVTQLNSEPLKPLLLESWEGVNFHNAGLCENLSRVAKSAQALVPSEHAQLKKAVAEAEAALAAAAEEVAPGE